jgi:hypothetical protein
MTCTPHRIGGAGAKLYDDLLKKQARERHPEQREALLHELQRPVYEGAMVAPMFEITGLMGAGSRVEDVRLKP